MFIVDTTQFPSKKKILGKQKFYMSVYTKYMIVSYNITFILWIFSAESQADLYEPEEYLFDNMKEERNSPNLPSYKLQKIQ